MSDVRTITNHVPRDIIDAWELTPKEREEFDYLDWQAIDKGEDSASFVRYRGELYDLSEFDYWHNPESPLAGGRWDGFRSDSFFSGLLVRYVNDFEQVVIGRYIT